MVATFGLEWQPSLALVPTFAAGLIAAILAVYVWHHRDRRAARPFTALLVGLCIWSVGYGIQLGFAAKEPMLAFDKVAFVGSVIVPTAWLLLAVEYAGYERWLSRRVLGALAVEPVVTLALVWTNERHGLIWRDVSVDASGPITILDLTFGPAYWANFGYSYLLVAVAVVLLASVVVRANRIHRRQSLVLLVGALVPLGANAAFNLVPRLNPVENLDLTTFAFAVTSLCFALALFRYRMLDLVPVARARLVERMDDGVVVIAADGTIVDLNPTAATVLANGRIGSPVSRTAIGDPEGVVEGYVSVDVDGESLSFDVSAMPISDFRGEQAGRFALMRNVTQLQVLRAHEQRLSVLNRLLRHNVRNELNVIAGRSRYLADQVEGSTSTHLDAIERATERIERLSDRARHIESTIANHDPREGPIDVAAIGARTLESVGADHPDAELELRGAERARATGVGREQFRRALEALVENAVVHNTSRPPRAWIDVETTDGTVRVSVADDGPGIPEMERSIIERGQETPLEHGTGLGLWLVKWIVDAANGDISFAKNETGGSTVTIELRRARPADGGP